MYSSNNENCYVAMIIKDREILNIKVFNNEFLMSYDVVIEEDDIDTTYVFPLVALRNVMNNVKALNQFTIKNGFLYEINKLGNEIKRQLPEVTNQYIPESINDFDISIYVSPDNLKTLKKHEKHKIELQEYPELNNLMIRQDENDNLLFYSTNGYSILETSIPVNEKFINGQYYASPILFKNLELDKIGIKKYSDDVEIGIKEDVPCITFQLNDANIYHFFSYTVFLKKTSIKLETLIDSKIINKKTIYLSDNFNIKTLSKFVVGKNKKEAKNNKYRVSFSIKDEYLMDGDELVMPLPDFPDIKIINGYDLLEILDNQVSVEEDSHLIGLCSNNQRLLLKKANV